VQVSLPISEMIFLIVDLTLALAAAFWNRKLQFSTYM